MRLPRPRLSAIRRPRLLPRTRAGQRRLVQTLMLLCVPALLPATWMFTASDASPTVSTRRRSSTARVASRWFRSPATTAALTATSRAVPVSQDFHIRRAVAPCQEAGVESYGVSAVDHHDAVGYHGAARELFAAGVGPRAVIRHQLRALPVFQDSQSTFQSP